MKKLLGSFYPGCSSKKTTFRKNDAIDGKMYIEDGIFKFEAKLLLFINIKSKNIEIPLEDIEKVETMKLNSILPYGVCVFTKYDTEFMFGHIKNQKLKAMIEEGRKEIEE